MILMKVSEVEISNEHGVTLVELLASIVLITLILTTFITIFIQSAKTYKTSENIIDATYVAQAEMEKIYAVSVITNYGERKNAMISKPLEYHYLGKEGNWLVYEKTEDTYTIKIKLEEKRIEINIDDDKPPIESDMNQIIVEAFDGPEQKERAKMQGILHWGIDRQ